MQVVPAARLEGVHDEEDDSEGSPNQTKTTHTKEKYIPGAPQLDAQVQALHGLARQGKISADTAERQINTYLLVPAAPPCQRKWLMMPLADAPHHSLMPDLGQIIHRVLARDPVPCSLSVVVEQCIPRSRHSTRPVKYDNCQPVFLTLIMGLLLGLYPGNQVKKPGFLVRSMLFCRLHSIMTGTIEGQTEFCDANQDIIHLACMEYLARIPPVYMPAQNKMLSEGDQATAAFFKRIPALCDELRQWVDDTKHSWEDIRAACALRVERVSRLKRGYPSQPSHTSQACLHHPAAVHEQEVQGGGAAVPLDVIRACWDVPALMDGTSDEYRLLALALDLPGHIIQRVQQGVRVYPLPNNLRLLQIESIQAGGPERTRAFYLQSRWSICARCLTTHAKGQASAQNQGRPRLRLDTLSHALVCATCLTPDPVPVNLLGRVMVYHKTHYYLCPSCTTVQPYRGGGEQPWPMTEGGCGHFSSSSVSSKPNPNSKNGKRKEACCVCQDVGLIQTVARVNHLTGEMQEFHYCMRHTPRPETARKCVNARQLAADPGPKARPPR